MGRCKDSGHLDLYGRVSQLSSGNSTTDPPFMEDSGEDSDQGESHGPSNSSRDRHSDHPTVVSSKASLKADPFPSEKSPFGESLVGKQLGQFQLEQYLGCGGMGAVFRATGPAGIGEVAVKVLRPNLSDEESIRRFRSEANNLALLNHHNIAAVYQVGEDQGWNFIVLEFVPGRTLFQYVQEQGPLDVPTLVALFSQLSDALQHAHDRGIVHRDLKPSNILFSDSGQVKLVDMGLALVQTDENSQSTKDEKDLTIGTVDYLSPEQARDPGSVDHQSDLYSLGCTMFFALTGKAPFHDRPAIKKLLNHSAPQRPSARDLKQTIPKSIDLLIQKLMAVDKRQRPRNAEEFRNELQRIGKIIEAESSRSPVPIVDRRVSEELLSSEDSEIDRFASTVDSQNRDYSFLVPILVFLFLAILVAILFSLSN